MSEARLARALGAGEVPQRDLRYTLGVLQRVERLRWHRTAWWVVVRGLAGAAGALAVGAWSGAAQQEIFDATLMAAAGVFFVIGASRMLRTRLQPN